VYSFTELPRSIKDNSPIHHPPLLNHAIYKTYKLMECLDSKDFYRLYYYYIPIYMEHISIGDRLQKHYCYSIVYRIIIVIFTPFLMILCLMITYSDKKKYNSPLINPCYNISKLLCYFIYFV